MKIWHVLLVMFLLFHTMVFASEVVLKSGQKLEGKIVEQTDKYVKFDSGVGVVTTYYIDEIDNIDGKKSGSFVSSVILPTQTIKTTERNQPDSQTIDAPRQEPATQTTNPSSSDQQLYLDQIHAIADKEASNDELQEAFNKAKNLLEKMSTSQQGFPKLFFDTLRLGNRIVTDQFIWDPIGSENTINDLDNIISQRGGLKSAIDLMSGYLKEIGISQQDWISYSLSTAYFSKGIIAAHKGEFEQARGYLKQLISVSSEQSKPLESEIAVFEKFYSEETQLLPLYKIFLENGHFGEPLVDAVHKLAHLYTTLDFTNATQGAVLENKLRQFKTILYQDVFKIERMDGKETTDVKEDHIQVLVDLLGGKADPDLRDLIRKSPLNDQKGLKNFMLLFACNYMAYLSEAILKSQGINIDIIFTERRDVNFAKNLWWKELADQWGLLKPNTVRQNHLCNIVWLSADKFVILDFANEYVSPAYSWKEDLFHIDGKHIFKTGHVYIKEFNISTPEESKAGLYSNFAGLFDGERQLKYLLQAWRFRKSALGLGALAASYYDAGHPKEAEELAQRALLMDNQNAGVLLVLARISIDKEQYPQAEQIIQRAIDADPDIGLSYNLLAKIYNDGYHDAVKAKEFLNKAVEVDEKNEDYDDAREIREVLNSMKFPSQ